MDRWSRYGLATAATACGAGVLLVLGARTGREVYALAGLVGVAMAVVWFLRYVHALLDAHAGAGPPDGVATRSARTGSDRTGFDTPDRSDR